MSLLFFIRIINMSLIKFIHFILLNYLVKTYLVPTICKAILGTMQDSRKTDSTAQFYGGTTFNSLHQNSRCNHQKSMQLKYITASAFQ